MSSQPPTGTVTFLFTDLEGSTRVLREIGRERYEELLRIHRRLMHEAVEGSDGYFVDKQGDACFAVFRSGGDAVAGAAEAQRDAREAPVAGRREAARAYGPAHGRREPR